MTIEIKQIERVSQCMTKNWVYRIRETETSIILKRVPVDRPFFGTTPLVQIYDAHGETFRNLISCPIINGTNISSFEEAVRIIEENQ